MESTTNGSTVNVLAPRREYPGWYRRGKLRKTDAQGNIVPNEYACNAEEIEVSPRFLRNGANYRIRPVRPTAFLSAWLYEHKHLPTLLTPEEAQQEAFLQLLDKLWTRHKNAFPQLGSPLAACDYVTVPGPRTGFSFNVLQALVEITGSVRPFAAGNGSRPSTASSSPDEMEALRQQIDALRARNAAATPAAPTPAVDGQQPAEQPVSPEQIDALFDAMDREQEEIKQAQAEYDQANGLDPLPTTEPSTVKPAANGKPGRKK